jgi:hypothetical protein
MPVGARLVRQAQREHEHGLQTHACAIVPHRIWQSRPGQKRRRRGIPWNVSCGATVVTLMRETLLGQRLRSRHSLPSAVVRGACVPRAGS